MTKKSRQKFKYLDNKKSFSDEMRSILHHFESTFIEAKKKKKKFFRKTDSNFKAYCIDVLLNAKPIRKF